MDTCQCRAWSAQSWDRGKPCAGPCAVSAQMSPATSHFRRPPCSCGLSLAQFEFFYQKEGEANSIMSLNLFHTLTYEGILLYHFPQ